MFLSKIFIIYLNNLKIILWAAVMAQVVEPLRSKLQGPEFKPRTAPLPTQIKKKFVFASQV
jgi:hypothetical protein